ncbi:hypothetical protein ES705_48363 [subsurface metagenome]
MVVWKAKSKIFITIFIFFIVTTGLCGYGCKSDRISEINKNELIKMNLEDVFYADFYLRGNRNKLTAIDCRPSDAIAIAVRLDCEIYVEPHVLDEVGIEIKTPEEEFKEL